MTIRVLTLNLQHALPGAGASTYDADTGLSVSDADITAPAQARTVIAALARQIRDLAPDIIALQEVDVGQHRSGRLNQAVELARALGWEHCRFAATYAGPVNGLRRRPRRSALADVHDDYCGPLRSLLGLPPAGFGNAVLTRFPVQRWAVQRLGRGPALLVRRGQRRYDPRSYRLLTASIRNQIAATIQIDDRAMLTVGSTHLATRSDVAVTQLEAAWKALATLPGPHLLAGDFNLTAAGVAATGVGRELGEEATYPAGEPVHRLDHMLTDPWPTRSDGHLWTVVANNQQPGHPATQPGSATHQVGDHARSTDNVRHMAPAKNQTRIVRATASGAVTFLVSDHAGAWVDVELVDVSE